jgi:hypothetical protein
VLTPLLVGLAVSAFAAFLGVTGWLVTSMIELKTGQAAIQAQHVNNGGSTMRDAVDRIQRTVDDIDSKVDAHLIEASADNARLADHLRQHPH